MLFRPSAAIVIIPSAAHPQLTRSRPKRIRTDPERDRTAWKIRQRRKRELVRSGKQLLTIKIEDGALIDALVKSRQLTAVAALNAMTR